MLKGRDVDHEGITHDFEPFFREFLLIQRAIMQNDHMAVRVPELGAFALFDFIAAHVAEELTKFTCIGLSSSGISHALICLFYARLEMVKAFKQVWAILDRQSHQRGRQGRILGL